MALEQHPEFSSQRRVGFTPQVMLAGLQILPCSDMCDVDHSRPLNVPAVLTLRQVRTCTCHTLANRSIARSRGSSSDWLSEFGPEQSHARSLAGCSLSWPKTLPRVAETPCEGAESEALHGYGTVTDWLHVDGMGKVIHMQWTRSAIVPDRQGHTPSQLHHSTYDHNH